MCIRDSTKVLQGHFTQINALNHRAILLIDYYYKQSTHATLEQAWKQWQKLLVEKIVAASADGAEQCPQQQEVIERLVGSACKLHRPVHNGVKVRLSTLKHQHT